MVMPNFEKINSKVSELYVPYLLEEIRMDARGKDLKKYMELFITLKGIVQRLSRYEIYFEKFFPENNDVIPQDEVLEYHSQNYISDLFILREKLLLFFRSLKNDLKKITVVKSSVDVAFKILEENIYSGFEQVSEIRNSHVHYGNLFADYKISSAKALRIIFESGSVPPEYDKEKLLASIKDKMTSHIDESKLQWIGNARRNYKNMEETTDKLFLSSKDYIFAVLDIKE